MAPAATQTSTAAQSKTSPKQNNKTPPKSESSAADTKADSNKTTSAKPDSSANATAAKPLAPPPKPGQNDTPDYFAGQSGGSLSLEPNPFEQSFGGGSGPETPGGTKLPSLASLTSPSSLLPGNNTTPFNWGGGSLRTGPLSPAMLSGPQNDYFSENHGLRGSYPTPNESGLRSGLTPGGSGSMFPAQSPNSQALFSQLASGGATPSTLDFHRTAMSAASKQANGTQANQQTQQQAQQAQQQTQPQQPQQQQQQAVTSQPQEMPAGATVKTEAKASGPFDPHDNDAANGLFMLAQGRNQGAGQFAGNANKAGGKANNAEADNGSEENDAAKPNTRGKGKKGQATNARRKAEEPPAAKAPPNKKAKAAPAAASPSDGEASDDDDEKLDEAGNKIKMTDEEKRKNFLERNRVAALKCRQRKKQWLANLQTKVEMFSSENDALTAQITQLREEVVNLKTLLLAHKDCPVTQQQGLHGAFMSQVVEPFNPQMNPYGMAPGMPQQQQQVMAGQPMQRRFS